jgi:unsaturated rhamnogalacturonyl hydrolase
MKNFLRACIATIFICSTHTLAQDIARTEKVLRSIADEVIHNTKFEFIDEKTNDRLNNIKEVPSDAKLKLQSSYTDWRYWNGVLNIAMLKLGDLLKEPAYTEFPLKNMAFSFDNYKYFEKHYNGVGKWNYPFGQRFIIEELDDCGAMGASVIEIFKSDQQQRYWDYVNEAANHMLNKQARLDDRTLVRSFPHKWTLWADDLYMSISFLSRMGELSNDTKYFDDAVRQVINFHKYLFEQEKGLMYHCWYSDVRQNGVAFWGRANGWALLAQADLLDRLPQDHKDRNELIMLFRKHILGISRYQSKEGLWHQLLDKTDSYLETSCSAMFTYAISRGVSKGYLDKRFISIAEKGWDGILTKINTDGQIEGVCAGTSVNDNLVFYYDRPTPLHDVHGIGAVLLAGTEILKIVMKK